MKRAPWSLFGRQVSVRTRLMAWNIGAVTVLMVVLGGIVQYSVQTLLLLSVDRELIHRARPFGGPPGPHGPPILSGPAGPPDGSRERMRPGWPHRPGERPPPGPFEPDRMDPGEQTRVRRAISQDIARRRGSMFYPRVLRLDGKDLFMPQGPGAYDMDALRETAVERKRRFTTVQVEGEPARILSDPILRDGKIGAVAQIPYPLTDTYNAIRGMQRTMLALIPVALILAGIGGAIVTGRALRPVRDVVKAAEQIHAHDLSQRLDVAGRDEFSHLAMTFNDMLARLESAFSKERSLVRRLEASLEQQQRFTADASHELKTPLTVAKVNADLLQKGPMSAEDTRESLQDIGQAIERMGRLVQDLLLLARQDAGQTSRTATEVMAQDVLRQAREGVALPNGPIRIEVADPTLTIFGDECELIRVFQNLMDNALRHSPSGGVVRVMAAAEEAMAVIQVADSGPGVAPEHLPHLGERFYRVDSSRARPDGGTGLGLSICRSIVESHGGTIRFDSPPGQGLTVRVCLPRTAPPEA